EGLGPSLMSIFTLQLSGELWGYFKGYYGNLWYLHTYFPMLLLVPVMIALSYSLGWDALVGLGMNLPEDAVYPIAFIDGEGDGLVGENRYRLHFTREQLPPALAFWSLTAYGEDHYMVHNPIDRYAVGSMTDLQYNADGSLDIYIQSESPGADKESNWLPVPKAGPFSLVCRLYDPKPEVLQMLWKMPAIEKAE
ncbi:MAG: DUF1214 domain-containing protein, partial [Oceanisphaera sp.]|nr:DUF1214 domain-containing protein [Oceanisphaera sp.]